MGKIYGYCRISTSTQNIERQVRNIKDLYAGAVIVEEVFTGTKVDGRKEFEKLVGEWTKDKNKVILKGGKVKAGDTIVFDSVSRMSRDSEEGFKLYKELFDKGIELEFIKEPHINTTTYKQAMTQGIELTGTDLDFILEGINKYLLTLAEQQIKLAFNQSEKEVKDLQQRTREGIETARLNGKQIGLEKGTKLTTKKSVLAKEQIQKYSKDFQGTLKDIEVMKLIGIARNSYYKYKKELGEELNKN
ncbi:recombinase family protein [[Clostridium] dakarense]|uniref:recombinase family protein n=1 Tax=Faecalimicrobium dakarense TaxID=1301100 RepID=UPI0004B9CB9F|nr:recombinase family protein [[Clostridium] dakarense]